MTLKNYLKPAKVHRERAQPKHRRNFGFLEKKKDYKKRAKNHNFKKDHLALLQRKAENRNPDEFYFSMVKSTFSKSGHIRNKKLLEPKEVLAMVEEDIKYLEFHLNIENNKIEKLQNENAVFRFDDSPNNKVDQSENKKSFLQQKMEKRNKIQKLLKKLKLKRCAMVFNHKI
ncbi:UTP11-like, U3 small nucleolar ribonucleoprotein [Bonamia ostreae]|uniref:UTP11-like, U3 small nucleolar ribonucleoprotein n=1 Tax=Bonamia ostreae TaxID=126728 RepID=A0ABV2ASL7_9EUKA